MKKNFFKAALMAMAMAVSIFAVEAASLNANKSKTDSITLNAEATSANSVQAHHLLMHPADAFCGHSMYRGSCNIPSHGCRGFFDANGDNYCDNCPGRCHAVTHQPR